MSDYHNLHGLTRNQATLLGQIFYKAGRSRYIKDASLPALNILATRGLVEAQPDGTYNITSAGRTMASGWIDE